MNNQDAFVNGGAGDRWYQRNKPDIGYADCVSALLAHLSYKPSSVLEIGCANGWRLKKLKAQYACRVTGIDPSKAAIDDGIRDGLDLHRGTADKLPFETAKFDLVVLGFCLCLVDPQDLFAVVAETDRVLAIGGLIVIHDRLAEPPLRRSFGPDPSITCYEFAPARLWLSHPCYTQLAEGMAEPHSEAVGQEMIWAIRKGAVEAAFVGA